MPIGTTLFLDNFWFLKKIFKNFEILSFFNFLFFFYNILLMKFLSIFLLILGIISRNDTYNINEIKIQHANSSSSFNNEYSPPNVYFFQILFKKLLGSHWIERLAISSPRFSEYVGLKWFFLIRVWIFWDRAKLCFQN